MRPASFQFYRADKSSLLTAQNNSVAKFSGGVMCFLVHGAIDNYHRVAIKSSKIQTAIPIPTIGNYAALFMFPPYFVNQAKDSHLTRIL